MDLRLRQPGVPVLQLARVNLALQGIEIHCVKKMDHVTQLEFLPYHMLLCGASDRGGLSWLDVSVGKMVTETWTKMGSLQVEVQLYV